MLTPGDKLRSEITGRDKVLAKRTTKANKLSSNNGLEPYDVVAKEGGAVLVRVQDTGVSYRRHISDLQKIGPSAGNDSNTDLGMDETANSSTGTSAVGSSKIYQNKDNTTAMPERPRRQIDVQRN